MPASLPASCLTMAPRLDTLESFNRKPLSEMDVNNGNKLEEVNKLKSPRALKQTRQSVTPKSDCDIETMLKTLEEQLVTLLKSKPGREMACSGILFDKIIYSACISILTIYLLLRCPKTIPNFPE